MRPWPEGAMISRAACIPADGTLFVWTGFWHAGDPSSKLSFPDQVASLMAFSKVHQVQRSALLHTWVNLLGHMYEYAFLQLTQNAGSTFKAACKSGTTADSFLGHLSICITFQDHKLRSKTQLYLTKSRIWFSSKEVCHCSNSRENWDWNWNVGLLSHCSL